jgi:precorrin-3B C17-methyltransferase
VWVFSGTRDGNALAHCVSESGHSVVLSVVSEQGKEAAEAQSPRATILAGSIGREARHALLRKHQPLAVLDATHPFATRISEQLQDLCADLKIPYLRFERESSPLPLERQTDVISVDSMMEAAEEAVQRGSRICLTTGIKDIPTFLQHPGAGSREWFARVTPSVESLEQALAAGIPRAHLCAMQGPFSEAANQVLWSGWQIDCVVSKESGPAGGVPAKVDAARALGIPLILVRRPPMNYPTTARSELEVIQWISSLAPSIR